MYNLYYFHGITAHVYMADLYIKHQSNFNTNIKGLLRKISSRVHNYGSVRNIFQLVKPCLTTRSMLRHSKYFPSQMNTSMN